MNRKLPPPSLSFCLHRTCVDTKVVVMRQLLFLTYGTDACKPSVNLITAVCHSLYVVFELTEIKTSKQKRAVPVCQTYCTHTYVLAAKNSHCTGMKRRQMMSEVNATHTKNTEKACWRGEVIMINKHMQSREMQAVQFC